MTTMRSEAIPEWDVADRMRKCLRTRGLAVQEMADYMGVSRVTVGNWINGRKAPSIQTLRLWAIRCGVPFEWLRDGVLPTSPDGGDGWAPSGSNRRPTDYKSADCEILTFPARRVNVAPVIDLPRRAERHAARAS